MRLEDLTRDQVKVLGGCLLIGTFDRNTLKLSDTTDDGIEKSCSPLVDKGFLTYELIEAAGRFPRGCFKTTQSGWELLLNYKDWKLERVSPEDRVAAEAVWCKESEGVVDLLYQRKEIERQRAVIQQERVKLDARIAQRDRCRERAWNDLKVTWHSAPLSAKLVIMIMISPILFLICLGLRILAQAVLGW